MYQPKQKHDTEKYRKIAIGLATVGIILALGYAAVGFITTQSNSDQGISIADYEINAQVADAQVDTTDGRVDFVNITYDDVNAEVRNIPSGDHRIKFNNTFKRVENADANGSVVDDVNNPEVLNVTRPNGISGPTPSENVSFANGTNEQTTDNFATGTNFTEEVGSDDTTNFTMVLDAHIKVSVNNGNDTALLEDPVRPVLRVSSQEVLIAEFTIQGQLNAQAPSGS